MILPNKSFIFHCLRLFGFRYCNSLGMRSLTPHTLSLLLQLVITRSGSWSLPHLDFALKMTQLYVFHSLVWNMRII